MTFIKKVSHQSFMGAEGGADVSSDQGCCCRRSLEIIYKLNVENHNCSISHGAITRIMEE